LAINGKRKRTNPAPFPGQAIIDPNMRKNGARWFPENTAGPRLGISRCRTPPWFWIGWAIEKRVRGATRGVGYRVETQCQ